jgi:hypothetical protein
VREAERVTLEHRLHRLHDIVLNSSRTLLNTPRPSSSFAHRESTSNSGLLSSHRSALTSPEVVTLPAAAPSPRQTLNGSCQLQGVPPLWCAGTRTRSLGGGLKQGALTSPVASARALGSASSGLVDDLRTAAAVATADTFRASASVCAHPRFLRNPCCLAACSHGAHRQCPAAVLTIVHSADIACLGG